MTRCVPRGSLDLSRPMELFNLAFVRLLLPCNSIDSAADRGSRFFSDKNPPSEHDPRRGEGEIER